MEIENPHEAYLVVAETIDALEWDQLFRSVSGLTAAGRVIPASLAMPMALVFEAIAWLRRKPVMLNRNAIRHVTQRQQYDCTRASEDLGISYLPVDVTLRDTIRWYVDNGWVTNEENLAIVKETLAAPESAVA
jgi:nucleoside-diphosphate-sugar epimerase